MTLAGLLYDPTAPDPVVLSIDGPDYLADGWATGLDAFTPLHKSGCRFADIDLQDACACQPPL